MKEAEPKKLKITAKRVFKGFKDNKSHKGKKMVFIPKKDNGLELPHGRTKLTKNRKKYVHPSSYDGWSK